MTQRANHDQQHRQHDCQPYKDVPPAVREAYKAEREKRQEDLKEYAAKSGYVKYLMDEIGDEKTPCTAPQKFLRAYVYCPPRRPNTVTRADQAWAQQQVRYLKSFVTPDYYTTVSKDPAETGIEHFDDLLHLFAFARIISTAARRDETEGHGPIRRALKNLRSGPTSYIRALQCNVGMLESLEACLSTPHSPDKAVVLPKDPWRTVLGFMCTWTDVETAMFPRSQSTLHLMEAIGRLVALTHAHADFDKFAYRASGGTSNTPDVARTLEVFWQRLSASERVEFNLLLNQIIWYARKSKADYAGILRFCYSIIGAGGVIYAAIVAAVIAKF